MTFRASLLILCVFALFGCSDDDLPTSQTLKEYLDSKSDLPIIDELIACAAGGEAGFLDDPQLPLSVILKPHDLGISDLRYFESQSTDIDPNDNSLFFEKTPQKELLFNGFLERFMLPTPEEDTWAKVTFVANDSLWSCKPIRLKYLEQPSSYNSIFFGLINSTNPAFTWSDTLGFDNAIYFQMISEKDGPVISGTYTTETNFKFYDLSNVVLNVSPPNVPSSLDTMKEYTFTLMSVSADNWVNSLYQVDFPVF